MESEGRKRVAETSYLRRTHNVLKRLRVDLHLKICVRQVDLREINSIEESNTKIFWIRKQIALNVRTRVNSYFEVATYLNCSIGFKNCHDWSRTALGSLFRLDDLQLKKTTEIRFDL